jgi:ubiquinone/menaquinone biosynthesis C-methylase UbiE
MKTTAASITPWTAHWQFDSATNQSDRPELDLLIEPVWHEFTDLLSEGARILDLATGNGTVALSCAERARARRLQLHIDAVDAAGIKPPPQTLDPEGHLPQVRFQGDVWLEDLPFKDGEFNGVMSQYGFEYADEEQAVSEASRVLSPDGRLRLVIHARDGTVWRDIDYRYKRLHGVLAENGVVNLILALTQAQQNQDADTFKRKLKHLPAATQEAQELADQAPSDDSALFYSREFLYVWAHRKQYKLTDLLRSLEEGCVHARGTAERYAQMLRVARSAEDIARLCGRLETDGLTTSSVRQICNPGDGAQIAWQVDVSKPG